MTARPSSSLQVPKAVSARDNRPPSLFVFRDFLPIGLGALSFAGLLAGVGSGSPWLVLVLAITMGALVANVLGVRVRLQAHQMSVVNCIRLSARTIEYREVASVKTIGAGDPNRRSWWAPGLQLRVRLHSGEDFFIRATHGPFVTRRARSQLSALEGALQTRL